jgi:two-component system, chemotaxis family, protein-glutamate methylesterase/glutaminase
LPAAAAVDGERIRPGRVYVAPPDKHMLVVKDTVRLSRGPRQNGVRPAADPLFRSAALYAGPRVIGVVLSGTMDDAALGSATVERRGGRIIVQDPDDADYDSMPISALGATQKAVTAPAALLGEQLIRLVTERVDMPFADTSDPDDELAAEIAGLLTGISETSTEPRTYSQLTCPECGGPLYRATEEHAETYDCLVGHCWALGALIEEQSAAVERALWLAIRSLEERGRLTARLAAAARGRGHGTSAEQFAKASAEAQASADAIRSVATGMTAEVASRSEQA